MTKYTNNINIRAIEHDKKNLSSNLFLLIANSSHQYKFLLHSQLHDHPFSTKNTIN